MTGTELMQQPAALDRPFTAPEIRAQVNLIQEVMKAVMKDGVHYGTIKGTTKPTLYKPGSEKILSTFHIAIEPIVTDLSIPGDEARFRVETRATSQHSQTYLGSGVGEASSHEEKYKWRAAVCDEEWNETAEDRRRAVWKKGEGGKAYQVKQVRTQAADIANCVTPDTLVLTHDLQWVPAGEIESGDRLIGVEEDLTNEYARHLSIGEAIVHGRRTDALYEIKFEDGRTVRCNGEHQWLVKKIGLKGTEWVATQEIHDEIRGRKGRPRKWTVMSLCQPWSEDASKEAGYLAGLFDADGSFASCNTIATFAQQQNTVLAGMQRGLIARGYSIGVSACKTQDALDETESGKQVYTLRVRGGLTEQMRLLGSLRPPRLIERWLTLVNLEKRRLEGRGSGAGRPVEIVSVEAAGEGEIVMLSTTCRTYIAEGLVCHNTILKMAKKRSQIDVTLTVTAASDVFAQDIEDLPDELRETAAAEDGADQRRPPIQPPQPKAEPRREAPREPQRRSETNGNGARPAAAGIISEAQARRFYAIAKGAGWKDDELKEWLKSSYGLDSDRDIPRSQYEAICTAVQQPA